MEFKMLVLTRKVGQQVVVPECGMTIDVVGLSSKQVRLGITAPSATQVHRSEVWQRIRGEAGVPPEENGQPVQETPPHDDRTEDPATMALFEHDEVALGRLIAQRLAGRACVLTVQTAEGRTVIHGFANSFYHRQLIQAAVAEAVGASAASIEVEYNIEVVDGRAAGTIA
jgi:carbon storage regulator